jgi:hypothetical protein
MLALLTACVSYYQPEMALEDGVYYPEDDPSYNYNPDDFSGIVYYPWVSLDYFYFGYRPYPYSGFIYNYPYGYGFVSWVYPYPYYARYSPWYYTYYYDPYFYPRNGNCGHHGHCRRNNDDGGGDGAGDDSYAVDNRQYHKATGGSGEENAFYSRDMNNKMSHAGTRPTKRVAASAPGRYPVNKRTVVSDGRSTKTGKHRVEPVYSGKPGKATAGPPVSVRSAPAAPAAPAPTFSRPDTGSPSFNSSVREPPSSSGKSTRHRDRD